MTSLVRARLLVPWLLVWAVGASCAGRFPTPWRDLPSDARAALVRGINALEALEDGNYYADYEP